MGNDCLADATCAAGQTCADACACGDSACIANCAKQDPSPKALPVLMCAKTNCGLEAPAIQAAMPDCSTTACPSKCQCIEQNCASQINDCLADAKCASGQACADNCACGDKACIMACATKNPSAKALPIVMCAKSKCGLHMNETIVV